MRLGWRICFYRGRSKGKYLPQGQGFIYSTGGSQITPKGLWCLWSSPKESVFTGGIIGTVSRARGMISVNVQGTLICQRANNRRRHDLSSQGPHKLVWKKRHDMYKIIKDTGQYAWHIPSGPPGEGGAPTIWASKKPLRTLGLVRAVFNGTLHVLSFLHIFRVLCIILVSTALSALVTYKRSAHVSLWNG